MISFNVLKYVPKRTLKKLGAQLITLIAAGVAIGLTTFLEKFTEKDLTKDKKIIYNSSEGDSSGKRSDAQKET